MNGMITIAINQAIERVLLLKVGADYWKIISGSMISKEIGRCNIKGNQRKKMLLLSFKFK